MKPLALALGATCVAAGTAVGFLLGKNAAALAPPDAARSTPGDGAALAELRDLSARVARLQESVADLRMAPDRQPMPLPANAEATTPELEPLVARLSRLVERLDATASNQAHEALRVARQQRPQPDFAATEALRRQLQDSEAVGTAARLAVEREWVLLGMDEVVQRLGMPSEVQRAQNGETDWYYQRPGSDDVLSIHFQNGLVIAVH